MSRFRRVREMSAWRDLALSAWGSPGDPTVYGALEIDATRALALLARLRSEHRVTVTLTQLVAWVAGRVIADNPEVNAAVRMGRLFRRPSVDVSVVVTVARGRGLRTIKVIDADRMSFLQMAKEIDTQLTALRPIARDAALHRQRRWAPILTRPTLRLIDLATALFDLDLSRLGISYDLHGSVLVTDVGMLGLPQAFAALVPLGRTPIVVTVGAVRDRAVPHAGVVAIRPTFVLGATFDHRVVDGFHIGRIARQAQRMLEDPEPHV